MDISNQKSEAPEFVAILDILRNELSNLAGNSEVIFNKLNTFKNFIEPEELKKSNPSQDGIIGEFYVCIDRLREYNNSLEKSRRALIKLIG